MNLVKSLTLGLIGLSGLALGQTEAPAAKLNALVQLKTGGAARVELNKANGSTGFTYTHSGRVGQAKLKDCRLFMIESPADLVAGITAYRAGDLKKARTTLSSVKRKYTSTLGLPNNPSAQAAYYELLAAIRLQDWAGVKSLVGSYPKSAANSDRKKQLMRVAFLMGEIAGATDAAKGAELGGKIAQYLADKKVVKQLDLEFYGFARYAQARALIAQLPVDAVKKSDLSGADAEKAIDAVDMLCEFIVSQHGANREFTTAAMVEAAKLLWSLKESHEYLVEIGLNVDMKESAWKKAPVNFREAATLAFMAMQFSDTKIDDSDLAKIARFYFGPAKEALKN